MQLKPGYEEENHRRHQTICWACMTNFMGTHPDNSPVCTPLRKVFHPD
jgi:L-rhamnose mutarotase